MQKTTKQYLVEYEKELDNIDIMLSPWDRIFFVWDLGTGKTTLIRHILRKYTNNPSLIVRSPTYTYYERYGWSPHSLTPKGNDAKNPSPIGEGWGEVYHFDLYRLDDISTFYSIGWIEIMDDRDTIMLIEWPEILWDLITPTQKISLKLREDGKRVITIETFRYDAVL